MNTKPARILIVDDDEDIRANFCDILADLGYETETAADAEIALNKICSNSIEQECEFDLCLFDFKMPGMNGAELIEQIRNSYPDLPAIMITAYAGEQGVKEALKAGTWKVLRKPVDMPFLLGLIREAVA